jgi:magnesium chelatase accessory protein
MDRPDWARDGRDWPNRDASQFIKSDNITWHVQMMGKGPVLLLLHGTGAATHSWRDLMPLLAKEFLVVAPDLPGHGFTRGAVRNGPTLPHVASAVAALLAVMGHAPTLVAGHSAGAAIALRMVLDGHIDPQMAAALSPALLPFPGFAAQLFPTLARLLLVNPFAPHIAARMARSAQDVRRFLEKSTGSTIDQRGIDDYTRLFQRAGHVQGTIALMGNWDLLPMQRDLARIAIPLTIIHGDRDAAIPISQAHTAVQAVAGAQLEILSGSGHLAHEEQPARVAKLIQQHWLKIGSQRKPKTM